MFTISIIFFKKFNKIISLLGIQNEYEFHNFIKKLLNQNPNITLLKMPIIMIKCNDKDKFFHKIIKEFNLTKNEFYNKLIEDYGFNKITAVSTINYDYYKYLQISNEYLSQQKDIKIDNESLIKIKRMINDWFKNANFFKKCEYENFLKENQLKDDYKNINFLEKLGFYLYDNKYICANDFNITNEIKNIIKSKGIYKNELSMYYNQKRSLQSCLQNLFKFLNVIQIKDEYVVSYEYFETKSNIKLEKFITELNNYLIKQDEKEYFLLNNLLKQINFFFVITIATLRIII